MTLSLPDAYAQVRKFTERLVQPLSAEDCMIQSMDDASPTRWHLAHTTWFFETFLLEGQPGYKVFDPLFKYLFNSYYNTVGEQFPRGHRGMVSRPGLDRILEYREYVDQHMITCLGQSSFEANKLSLLQTGIQHEQQHQELILTDIKHALSCNPTWPAYEQLPFEPRLTPTELQSQSKVQRINSSDEIYIEEGLYKIGYAGDDFSFDNESPRHSTYLHACSIDQRLVTCGEYLNFMEAGGYETPQHWLSLGWYAVQEHRWRSPMYWYEIDGQWMQYTLSGLVPVDLDAPVAHVSFFEADAFARWCGRRLPTEMEWEVAAIRHMIHDDDPFVDHLLDRNFAVHPTRFPSGLCGSVWQWTSSSYLGYPGYKPPQGAVGEYNGKFMCDQHVLRGGSVATHSRHIRQTYRNFFPATARWQFSGIRLAK